MSTPSRRAVLIGSLLAAAGCAAPATAGVGAVVGSRRGSPPAAPAQADGLDALAAAEDELVAAYAAAITQRPALASELRAVQADHLAHAAALRRAGASRPSGRPSAAAPDSTTPSTAAPSSAAPAPMQVQTLEAMERTSADRCQAEAAGAAGGLAALFGAIAASEASHEIRLGALRRSP